MIFFFFCKEKILVSDFLTESIVLISDRSLPFIQDRNSFYFPVLAFLVFPVVLVMLQVSSQEKISLSSFSSCHSFAGESTIWIQDDGLQVLHHYQERFETLFFRRFNMVNSLVQDYNYCCWYLHIIFMRVLWDVFFLADKKKVL